MFEEKRASLNIYCPLHDDEWHYGQEVVQKVKNKRKIKCDGIIREKQPTKMPRLSRWSRWKDWHVT